MYSKSVLQYIAAYKQYEHLKKDWDVVLEPILPSPFSAQSTFAGNWAWEFNGILEHAASIALALKQKIAVIVHDSAGTFQQNKYLKAAARNDLGYNTSSDSDLWDHKQHGLHVAGTYGAVHPTQKLGIMEEAVKKGLLILVPAKCLNRNGAGSYQGIEENTYRGNELGRKLQKQGYKILRNYSLGGGGWSDGVAKAIEEGTKDGHIFLAAAGNTYGEGLQFPAKHPDVIAVGSCDQQGRKSSFSTWGEGLFCVAPGQNIRSTIAGDKLADWNGTSMATPNQGAILGLLWSMFPEIEHTNHAREFLKASMTDTFEEGYDKKTGWGYSAIGRYLDADPGDPPTDEPDEEPDQPDQPAPTPEPTKPKRSLTLFTQEVYWRFWRGRSTAGPEIGVKANLTIEASSTQFIETEYEFLIKEIKAYLQRSGLLINEKSDAQDVARFMAWFLEIHATKRLDREDVKVKKVEVIDCLGASFPYEVKRHFGSDADRAVMDLMQHEQDVQVVEFNH